MGMHTFSMSYELACLLRSRHNNHAVSLQVDLPRCLLASDLKVSETAGGSEMSGRHASQDGVV
jgi:hypothetical protein